MLVREACPKCGRKSIVYSLDNLELTKEGVERSKRRCRYCDPPERAPNNEPKFSLKSREGLEAHVNWFERGFKESLPSVEAVSGESSLEVLRAWADRFTEDQLLRTLFGYAALDMPRDKTGRPEVLLEAKDAVWSRYDEAIESEEDGEEEDDELRKKRDRSLQETLEWHVDQLRKKPGGYDYFRELNIKLWHERLLPFQLHDVIALGDLIVGSEPLLGDETWLHSNLLVMFLSNLALNARDTDMWSSLYGPGGRNHEIDKWLAQIIEWYEKPIETVPLVMKPSGRVIGQIRKFHPRANAVHQEERFCKLLSLPKGLLGLDHLVHCLLDDISMQTPRLLWMNDGQWMEGDNSPAELRWKTFGQAERTPFKLTAKELEDTQVVHETYWEYQLARLDGLLQESSKFRWPHTQKRIQHYMSAIELVLRLQRDRDLESPKQAAKEAFEWFERKRPDEAKFERYAELLLSHERPSNNLDDENIWVKDLIRIGLSDHDRYYGRSQRQGWFLNIRGTIAYDRIKERFRDVFLRLQNGNPWKDSVYKEKGLKILPELAEVRFSGIEAELRAAGQSNAADYLYACRNGTEADQIEHRMTEVHGRALSNFVRAARETGYSAADFLAADVGVKTRRLELRLRKLLRSLIPESERRDDAWARNHPYTKKLSPDRLKRIDNERRKEERRAARRLTGETHLGDKDDLIDFLTLGELKDLLLVRTDHVVTHANGEETERARFEEFFTNADVEPSDVEEWLKTLTQTRNAWAHSKNLTLVNEQFKLHYDRMAETLERYDSNCKTGQGEAQGKQNS